MNDVLFDLYTKMRILLKEFELEKTGNEAPETLDIVRGWEDVIEHLEADSADYKRRYERNKAIQESFTYEQKDFICYQIGEWYLDWKDRMATGKGTCHRLGYAKELLKLRLCGE